MESNACIKCAKKFESDDNVLTVEIELPCNHSLCAKCIAEDDLINQETIKCLICGEESKLFSIMKRVIKEARDQLKTERPIEKCLKHKQDAHYISDSLEFFCNICLLEKSPTIKSHLQILYLSKNLEKLAEKCILLSKSSKDLE